ncbi:TolC family protein [Pedobacter riviphilus]|uniref:TolC family protein n=1 Tax=Pedobacter riviphilus TaxID=2766984 RepID=A0ABX6TPC1_9SPHI|nr:TolC family protein [Pedobacter riviphilus]QNR86439.1 TolC family protein [Pedobacter riviphilus]
MKAPRGIYVITIGRKKHLICVVALSLFFLNICQAQQNKFHSVDSLFSYVSSKSITLQSGEIRIEQAKKARLAAILSIPDISGSLSFSYTHNTKLPVNLFPASVFGGQVGTFVPIQTGIPFVSTGNENIDVKLINHKGWENLKLSKLNIQSSIADNKLTIKSLYEDIASTYYNIVSLQQQLSSTEKNLQTAERLLQITINKYAEGLIKQQDVNEAKISSLDTRENYNQIKYQIQQQYLALKILCNFPEDEQITIQDRQDSLFSDKVQVGLSRVAIENSELKESMALSNYRQQKYALYPTLSFFQSHNTQQNNTRNRLFDRNVDWFNSSYIGLKLSIPIPSSSTIKQISEANYNYLLAQKDTEQQKIKAGIEQRKLEIDYYKVLSQISSYREIAQLRKENYEKNLNLYQQGLIDLQKVLDSYEDMVNSNYNLVSAQVSALAAKTKIHINNTIR